MYNTLLAVGMYQNILNASMFLQSCMKVLTEGPVLLCGLVLLHAAQCIIHWLFWVVLLYIGVGVRVDMPVIRELYYTIDI